MEANPKVEISAFKDGAWIRIAGELENDDRVEAKKSIFVVCMMKTMIILKFCILKRVLRHFVRLVLQVK